MRNFLCDSTYVQDCRMKQSFKKVDCYCFIMLEQVTQCTLVFFFIYQLINIFCYSLLEQWKLEKISSSRRHYSIDSYIYLVHGLLFKTVFGLKYLPSITSGLLIYFSRQLVQLFWTMFTITIWWLSFHLSKHKYQWFQNFYSPLHLMSKLVTAYISNFILHIFYHPCDSVERSSKISF